MRAVGSQRRPLQSKVGPPEVEIHSFLRSRVFKVPEGSFSPNLDLVNLKKSGRADCPIVVR